jgi:hypothetical protein
MASYKTGDVFALPLTPGEFLAGRVLLDVKRQCIRPRRVRQDSTLGFFNGSLLVEVYRTSSPAPRYVDGDVLVPGVFIDPAALDGGTWPVVGHRDVEPRRVEFPQALKGVGVHIHVVWGELSIPTRLSDPDHRRIGVYPTIEPSAILHEICLYHLGRGDEIHYPGLTSVELRSLARSDLRFSPSRQEVQRAVDVDIDGSYFETARRQAYDLQRFYE